MILASSPARAEVIPKILTDRVIKGLGSIDLLKDVSAGNLGAYLSTGRLYLGFDLNESVEGPESSTSLGVALKQMSLALKTTAGDYSFSDFYTNTTALIKEKGATTATSFYTLFGRSGQSQVQQHKASVDSFDDIAEIRSVSYSGQILSATLNVQLLATAAGGTNESFFDFSGGYEELALFTWSTAAAVEVAAAGVVQQPGLTYTAAEAPAPSSPPPAPVHSQGAPEPAWLLLLGIPAWLSRRTSCASEC